VTAAAEMLKLEATAAWDEYLAATRDVPVHRYDQVEAWAWVRLASKLRAIHAREHALVAA
jgi:hypothetical protein